MRVLTTLVYALILTVGQISISSAEENLGLDYLENLTPRKDGVPKVL
jgi:hypothetical protein